MPVIIQCPCGAPLSVADDLLGKTVMCPVCRRTVTAPASAQAAVQTALPTAPAPGGVLGALVPYRNVPALLGYYFAVFALVPFLGVLSAIPALVLGIIGTVKACAHPEARGKGHALFAIIFSVACLVGQVLMVVYLNEILDAFQGQR